MESIVELFKESQSLTIKLNEYNNSISSLQIAIKEIEDKIECSEQRLNEINEIVASINVKPSNKSEEYNSNWSNTKKAMWALKTKGKCQTIRMIVDSLTNEDESYQDSEANRSLLSTMSGTISVKAKKKSVFCRYQDYEGGEWIYGLKDWFLDNDKVKDQYKF